MVLAAEQAAASCFNGAAHLRERKRHDRTTVERAVRASMEPLTCVSGNRTRAAVRRRRSTSASMEPLTCVSGNHA